MNNPKAKGTLPLLREAITASLPIRLTQSDQNAAASSVPFPIANYISFGASEITALSLSVATEFHSASKPADLRSVYFAWLQKDTGPTEYAAAVNQINAELGSLGKDFRIIQLTLVERSDLRGWLQGELNEIEQIYAIIPPDASADEVDSGAVNGQVVAGISNAEFLQRVYAQERKMGDRNTVLRGSKPQDFEVARRLADIYYKKVAPRPIDPSGAALPTRGLSPAVTSSSRRRHDPIILLSPSQSSLLRLSNVRSFLGESHFEPPMTSAATVSLAYMIREMRQLSTPNNPSGRHKFILTDSTENFRPDYWDRVVAVFTTGQTWQFKSYKWQDPPELFSHVLGVYLGWRGEPSPESVRGWGSGVLRFEVDKYRDTTRNGATNGPRASQMTQAERYRDREVVEGIWQAIAESMRSKGWAR